MLASAFLGTDWLSILVAVLGTGFGIWARPHVMKMLGKGDCCKK